MLPNVIMSISGKPKTGKSHLALTFPAPIVVFSFDIGLEPVLKKFAKKEITVKTYPMPIIDSVKAIGFQEEIKKIWDNFVDDFKATTEDTTVKTIVVDTWTVVYHLAQIARSKELGQANLLQFQFGDVYARLRGMIQRARLAGQNLVLTTYLRDRFVNDTNTGELEMDGWRQTESEVDVVLWTSRDTQMIPKQGKVNVIKTLIKDNRYDLSISGKELINTDFDELIAVLGVEE